MQCLAASCNRQPSECHAACATEGPQFVATRSLQVSASIQVLHDETGTAASNDEANAAVSDVSPMGACSWLSCMCWNGSMLAGHTKLNKIYMWATGGGSETFSSITL
jgi:hypothetical protein